MKKSFLKYVTAGALLGAGQTVMAQGVNTITSNLMLQGGGIVDVMGMLAYVGAVGLFIKAGLKLKEHTETKGQVPLSHPIVYAIVAAILFALPSMMRVGQESIFGVGASTTSISGGSLRSVR